MRPQKIIATKRDGGELSAAEMRSFIQGVTDGSWADYQITALVMAMFVRGLSEGEQTELTSAMLHSGKILDLSAVQKPKGDKHSTGGVGDKTSLLIAPIVAACGAAVPMISGRGLGHTGGTLDKLEAITGYNVRLDPDEMRRVIDECGFAMAGQTAEIAPADRKIYALRDATATVPCIPLIVSSIMSKKIAEGLDALVLDVKTGSGAFMQRAEDSRKLASALVRTGEAFGVRTEAVISDMGQPLGKYVGNAIETYECLKALRGDSVEGSERMVELSLDLSARLLVLSGISDGIEEARSRVRDALDSGRALELFRRNIELQGGDANVCEKPESLIDTTLERTEISAASDGYLAAVNTFTIGNCVVELGGGRTRADESVDHAVGMETHHLIGDAVAAGDTLITVLCRPGTLSDPLRTRLTGAFTIAEERPSAPPLIHEVIDGVST